MRKPTKKIFQTELEVFYKKIAQVTLNDEIIKAFHKVGRELAKEVIKQYDFKQMIKHKVKGPDSKIIITTIFERKDEKTNN